MSTIAHLPGGIKLSINENDHNPPHRHLECPEGRFRVFFHDLSVQTIVGSQTKARKDIAEVQAWMLTRAEVLRERWAAKEREESILPVD